MKTCSRCKVEKPLDAFSPDKRRSDGVTPWCKACRNSYANERRATISDVREKSRRHSRAVQYAKARLLASHRSEYFAYLREEQARLGINVKESVAR